MSQFSMLMSVLTALVVLVVVIAPFFFAKGGKLAAASAIDSLDQLDRIKRALVERYAGEERAFAKKEISERAWKARREFLLRKFIDAARRIDYLKNTNTRDQEGGEA